MRMMSIASGSSGNCIYIGSEKTHILIDDGISRKRVTEGLRELDLDVADLSAVLVTHEHADHVDGLGVLLRKNSIPVYASTGTIGEIKKNAKLGRIPKDCLVEIAPDKDFMINDLRVHPIHISHDASEPLAYTVTSGDKRCGVVTDLGVYDDYVVENFQGLNALLLEANHDVRMLEVGSYPYQLKKRILGNRGHLSNEAAGRLLGRLLNTNMKGVFLGHLSHENNYPELAYETVRFEVDSMDSDFRFHDFNVQVASRTEASDVIEF